MYCNTSSKQITTPASNLGLYISEDNLVLLAKEEMVL
jgi:hypothetical protein